MKAKVIRHSHIAAHAFNVCLEVPEQIVGDLVKTFALRKSAVFSNGVELEISVTDFNDNFRKKDGFFFIYFSYDLGDGFSLNFLRDMRLIEQWA